MTVCFGFVFAVWVSERARSPGNDLIHYHCYSFSERVDSELVKDSSRLQEEDNPQVTSVRNATRRAQATGALQLAVHFRHSL